MTEQRKGLLKNIGLAAAAVAIGIGLGAGIFLLQRGLPATNNTAQATNPTPSPTATTNPTNTIFTSSDHSFTFSLPNNSLILEESLGDYPLDISAYQLNLVHQRTGPLLAKSDLTFYTLSKSGNGATIFKTQLQKLKRSALGSATLDRTYETAAQFLNNATESRYIRAGGQKDLIFEVEAEDRYLLAVLSGAETADPEPEQVVKIIQSIQAVRPTATPTSTGQKVTESTDSTPSPLLNIPNTSSP